MAATADQLTAVNIVVSWLESAGMLTSGLLAGVDPYRFTTTPQSRQDQGLGGLPRIPAPR